MLNMHKDTAIAEIILNL